MPKIMKNKILLGLSLMLFSCKHKPDFCKDGQCYKVREVCVQSHSQTIYTYMKTGNTTMLIPNTIEICDTYIIDTVPFKK